MTLTGKDEEKVVHIFLFIRVKMYYRLRGL